MIMGEKECIYAYKVTGSPHSAVENLTEHCIPAMMEKIKIIFKKAQTC